MVLSSLSPPFQVVPLEYLVQLHDLHEKWMNSITDVPVLVVDANLDVGDFPDIYSRHEHSILRQSKPPKSRQPLVEVRRNIKT